MKRWGEGEKKSLRADVREVRQSAGCQPADCPLTEFTPPGGAEAGGRGGGVGWGRGA